MNKILEKRAVKIVLIVMIFAGLCLILYPTVSDWWNTFHQTRVIASYVETVEGMTEKECEKLLEEAYAYNEKLAKKNSGFILSQQEEEAYNALLDISGTGVMGYIQIPSIGVNLPVRHGAEADILQTAIGHIPGSSLPVGGESSHCLISGHRGLPSAKLFSDLDRLETGDIFTLTVLDQTSTYQVDEIRVVLPEEQNGLGVIDGEDYCTLITCTPYGVNSHRLLVRGRRIQNLPEEQEIKAEAVKYPLYRVVLAVAVPLAILMFFTVFFYQKMKHPKKGAEEILEAIRRKEQGERKESGDLKRTGKNKENKNVKESDMS